MNRGRWQQMLHQTWYGGNKACLLLMPLAWLYCAVVVLRRLLFQIGVLSSTRIASKLIVVGNVVAGGTGKTPFVIALTRHLQQAGLSVGIVTRGYGGRSPCWPQRVSRSGDPLLVGDEAVLLARRTGVPVVAGPDRVAAAQALLDAQVCDVLISDDGLQHYALQRDMEIALIDAKRGHGNGHCLPAGPLREPVSRLRSVDIVVALGDGQNTDYSVALQIDGAYRLSDMAERHDLAVFSGQKLHAVAGIAHPERFFDMLQQAGLEIQRHVFPDHHGFQPADLAFDDDLPVLMTEKDAVKCEPFAQTNWWYVAVDATIDPALGGRLLKLLG